MGSNASEENVWASTRVHNANTPLVPLTTLSTSNANADVAYLFRQRKKDECPLA